MTPLLVVALAVAAPGLKDSPKKDPPGPIGRWALQSGVVAGMPLPKTDLTISFTPDGKYESKSDGEVKSSGRFTADPKKQPAELDLTQPEQACPPVSPSIYRIEGDTLTICTSLGKDRPTSFDKAGPNTVLFVFKRLKD